MSYFTEIDSYKTYAAEADDFHFIYNANSGGGQSFLGGRFQAADGTMMSPTVLDGRVAAFRFEFADASGASHSLLLDDESACYDIKPRASGDSNMKLSVGRKTTPSEMVAAFLMLPEPCGVRHSENLSASVFCYHNYWLQSMWLKVDVAKAGKAIFTPRDCVFCGAVDKNGNGTARYYTIDISRRISDITELGALAQGEDAVVRCLRHYASIYKGEKKFIVGESAQLLKDAMMCLAEAHPDSYSGLIDPLTFLCELKRKEVARGDRLVDVDEFGLKIGDQSDDGAVTIVGADKLCYQVRNVSRGAEGIRTISKKLLGEWVIAVKDDPTATAESLRGKLTGKTEVDKFEYGYFSTLYKMAQMVLNKDSIKKLSAEELSRLIKDAKPLELSNADRLTMALKLFAEQRATWRAAMDKNKGPTYQSVNADVRAFFGKKENWDVEKLKSAEGLKDFCTNHTWMLRNGKGSWVQISGYDDAERKKLVDWIDEKIVKGSAALQNVIVDDNGLKGFTNKAVSELLMKFHPESYILCNGPTVGSLKFLRPEWAVKENYSYAEYLKVLGAAAVIRDRMAEMKIYATLDGTTTPDFLAVNEFIFFVSENKDLIEDVIKENAKMSDESKMKDVDKKVTTKQGSPKPLTAGDPDDLLMLRLKSALRAKPFVILAGHSGTGKSRIVRKLAYMTCNVDALMDQERGPQNFKMIQVKPNWHDSSDLLGYRSAIKDNAYVGTELIKFIFRAYTYPDTPFFLCLDEMNLAPVEQYFAEFLSAMESMKPEDSDDVEGKGDFVSDPVIDLDVSDKATKKDTNLWELGCESNRAYQWVKDHGFTIPKNLFVVGTVNMDESTNQFSRKVLDRAMTIEMTEASFANYGKVSEPSYADFEGNNEVAKLLKRPVRVKELVGQGEDIQDKEPKLLEVQGCLKETSFAIAFRFANEYVLYRKALKEFDGGNVMKVDALDHMVLMKVLPRIVGETEYVSNIFCGNRDPKNRANPTPKSLMGILSDPKMLSHDKMSQILKRGEEGASYLTFWP